MRVRIVVALGGDPIGFMMKVNIGHARPRERHALHVDAILLDDILSKSCNL